MRLVVLLILMLPVTLFCQFSFNDSIVVLNTQYLNAGQSSKQAKTKQLEKRINSFIKSDTVKSYSDYVTSTKALLGDASPTVAFLIHKKAVTFYYKSEFEKALNVFNQALNIRERLVQSNDNNRLLKEDLANSHFTVGAVLHNLSRRQEAINAFRAAQHLYQQTGNKVKQATCHHRIGQQSMIKNDIFEAINQLEQAKIIHPALNNNPKFCLDIGITYNKVKNYEQAIIYLKKAANSTTEPTKVYKTLGNTYDKLGQHSNALETYKTSLKLVEDSVELAILLDDIGTAHMKMNQFDLAKTHFEKALNIKQSTEKRKQELLNISYHNLGDLYARQQQHDQALTYFQKAINQLADQPESNNCKDPNFKTLEVNLPNLLKDYKYKGNTFYQWYKQTNNPQHLNCAYNTYQAFNQLMNKMQQEYANENSELFWLNEFYSTIETGLEVAYEKYQSGKAENDFQFILSLMEQNKANILLENLKRNNTLDSSKIGRIPTIHQIKENLLTENSALLNFFVGDSCIIVLSVSKSVHHVYWFPLDETLFQSIKEMLDVAREPSDDIRQFCDHSHQVFSDYLEPILKDLPTTVEELIIIPDGPFSYLPFDLLLTTPVSSSPYWSPDLPYLIKNYSTTYGYSAALLLQHRSDEKKISTARINAFAPEFKHLKALKNKEELTKIAEHFPVTNLTGTQATKNSFLEASKKTEILHLATHASASQEHPDSSYIAMADQPIYLKEIYQLKSNAQMAVLSACETGMGDQKRGEGVISLARAFTNAGIPSITMSLWSVTDQTTTQLMGNYYKHLSTGNTKHNALRQAKLDFLNEVTAKEYYHPHHWGAFAHFGDPIPLKTRTNPIWWLVGGLLILVVLLKLIKR